MSYPARAEGLGKYDNNNINNNNNNNHLISARRTRRIDSQQKTGNLPDRELCRSADHWEKLKENEKKDKNQDLARELKKTMEHESDDNTNSNRCDRDSHQRISKKSG